MRIFLYKLSVYLITGIALCVIYFFVRIKSDQLYFLSNSMSYNVKLKFIRQNEEKMQRAGMFIIGSSMALNNVDGLLIQDEFAAPVMNLSSWGMKISDFSGFEFLKNKGRTIIINIEFPDFGDSWIEKYKGFPLKTQYEFIHIIRDLKTYHLQAEEAERYTAKSGKHDYTSLDFDNTGSVVLAKNNFNIDPARHNAKIPLPSLPDLVHFVNSLRYLKNNVQVFIFFSPERNIFKDDKRKQFIDLLEKSISARYNNMRLYNNYTLNYGDSLFVDNCHLNDAGRALYTKTMIAQIHAALKK